MIIFWLYMILDESSHPNLSAIYLLLILFILAES